MIANYNKNELKSMLLLNNNLQPKAKCSNNILLKMLNKIDSDFNITIENTKANNTMFNRGVACELLVKIILNQYLGINEKVNKSQAYQNDLETMSISDNELKKLGLPKSDNIEIKMSTNFASGSIKNNNAKWCIVINESGAYLVESKNLNKDSKNHIARLQPKGVKLEKVNELLGL